ncbi:transmembrane and coiled-coil domains-containing protein 7 [Chamberlinius hualienensis]
MNRIAQIESVIKLLTTVQPSENSPEPNKGAGTVENSFKETLKQCQTLLQNDPQYFWVYDIPESNSNIEGDFYWEYVKFGLKILKCLNDYLSTESTSQETSKNISSTRSGLLNIKQQNSIQKTCEFIVILGVGRNLVPGLGIPWEKRSKFTAFISKNDNYDHFQRQQQLYATIKTLMEISQYHVLGNVLFSKYLQDLLAGLCQLTYWPLKGVLSSETKSIITEVKTFSSQLLHSVVERAYQPKVIRELLFLQASPMQQGGSTGQQTPEFIRKNVSKLLVARLLRNGGIKSFALAILESGDNEDKIEQRDWVKCDVIVRIISSFAANKEHYVSLCPQILKMLEDDSEEINRRNLFIRIAKMITINFVAINQELANDLIFYHHFKSLMACSIKMIGKFSLPKDQELEYCITRLHKVYATDAGPSHQFSKFLSPVVGILFHLYSFLNAGISHLKSLTEKLLLSYVTNIDKSDIVNLSQRLLLDFDKCDQFSWNSNLQVNNGPEGGILITERTEPSLDYEWLDLDNEHTSAFCKLLLALNDDDKVSTLFLSLLEELSSGFDDENANVSCINEEAELINIEKNQRRKTLGLRKSLITLNILSNLSQNTSLQNAIMKNKAATVAFMKGTFERAAKLCLTHETELMSNETLQMAMSLLTLVADEQELTKVKDDMKSIISSLEIIADQHSNEDIKVLAEQLYTYIATMGAIPLTRQHVSSNITSADSSRNFTTQTKPLPDLTPSTVFQQLFKELQDSDIPIKGHALLNCTKLIQSKNEELLKDKEVLFEILMACLEHEDSYVYLLATQSVAALAVEYPNFTLPALLEKYSDQSNPLLQMKVGEVILKIIVQLNDVVVIYRDRLINSFLNSSKSHDPVIRASGLSNLGELCKGLKFSLGNNINELFLHLSNFAKYDASPQVRSAAIQVITLLLRGLGKDAIKVLENVLKEIYGLLKHIYAVDKDDVVKLHVEQAQKELDIICRDFLFPKLELKKNIRVLERF